MLEGENKQVGRGEGETRLVSLQVILFFWLLHYSLELKCLGRHFQRERSLGNESPQIMGR